MWETENRCATNPKLIKRNEFCFSIVIPTRFRIVINQKLVKEQELAGNPTKGSQLTM